VGVDVMDEVEFKDKVRRGFDEASVGYDKAAMKFFDNSNCLGGNPNFMAQQEEQINRYAKVQTRDYLHSLP